MTGWKGHPIAIVWTTEYFEDKRILTFLQCQLMAFWVRVKYICFGVDYFRQFWSFCVLAYRTSVNHPVATLPRSQAVARIADRIYSQHQSTFGSHMTSSVTWPFDTQYVISYWWSFGTESLNPAVLKLICYWALSILGSRVWPFRVTWRHRSHDHLIAHMLFPIGGPLEPSLYL